jgi:hypothetical protein
MEAENKYENLSDFLGVRFHNMWPEEYGTWENAINDICKSSGLDWLQTVLLDLQELIGCRHIENILQRIVTEQCNANIYAPGIGLTYQQWLEKVDEILMTWVEKKRMETKGGN